MKIQKASLLLAALPLIALANQPGSSTGDNFYTGKSDGWFWYQDPPVEAEEEAPPLEVPPVVATAKAPAPPPQAVEPSGPPPFSVAWLKEKFPEARQQAIDDPNPENMRRYYYLQRIILDKAQRFADVSREITISDPLIDESTRRSTSSFAANAQTKNAGLAQIDLLQKLSSKAGLFFFYKANCDICLSQAQVLKSFKTYSEFTIIPISLDGSFLEGNPFGEFRRDSGQAKQLGITDAPALALAIPPKTARIVSFAPIAADALRGRVVLVAKSAGLISEEEYRRTLPYNDTGYLIADGMERMPPELFDSPKKFNAYIQQQANKLTTNSYPSYTDVSGDVYSGQGSDAGHIDAESEVLKDFLPPSATTPP